MNAHNSPRQKNLDVRSSTRLLPSPESAEAQLCIPDQAPLAAHVVNESAGGVAVMVYGSLDVRTSQYMELNLRGSLRPAVVRHLSTSNRNSVVGLQWLESVTEPPPSDTPKHEIALPTYSIRGYRFVTDDDLCSP